MKRRMGFWARDQTGLFSSSGGLWWGDSRGGESHIQAGVPKLAGLCGVAGWVVESGEARLQSLAGGEEIHWTKWG